MKKREKFQWIVILILAMLTGSLAGCGKAGEPEGSLTEPQESLTESQESLTESQESLAEPQRELVYVGESLLSAREVQQPPSSDKYRTFYEIFVYSFWDSNGDGIGDLAGVTQKLDYLNDGDPATDSDLGINGIWLMPVMPSNTYHKYDVKDYMAILKSWWRNAGSVGST